MLYIYKYTQNIYTCVTIQEYKETHCTTTIHKQKNTSDDYINNHTYDNAQILTTTTTKSLWFRKSKV